MLIDLILKGISQWGGNLSDDPRVSDISDVFFELSSDLMCVSNLDGVIQRVNLRWKECCAPNNGKLASLSFFDLVHPDDLPIARTYYRHLLSGSQPTIIWSSAVEKLTPVVSFRLRHNDGSYIWLDWNAIYKPDLGYVCFVGRDVTEDLRRESYLTKLMDITGTGFWEIDLDTKQLYWSQTVHTIHETDPLTYKPALTDGLQFYHPDSLPILSAAIANQMATGEAYDLELKFITAKGNHRWVRAVSQTEMQDGKVIRCYGTFQDITSKIHRRNENKKLQDRVDLALRASNIGVWDLDLVTSNLVWDEQMYCLYGIDEMHFAGAYDAWTQSLHPEDRAMCEREYADALAGIKEFSPRFRIITPTGEIRYLAAVATVTRNEEGNAIRMLGVNWDVTDQEVIKAELLAQKLLAEKSDVAKSQFIANMSHELRTPLNSVIGFSARLLKNQQAYDERTVSSVESINKNGHHLLSLINDILDLSKMDAGHLNLKYTPVPSAFFFGSIFEDFRASIEDKGLDFHIDVQGEKTVYIDELRCKQVVLNLISNALKFTQVGYIAARVRTTDDELCFEIEDSGIGIRKDDQTRMFRRFEQFDEDSCFKIGYGTGLGLSISREIIRMHGGTIVLTSEYGKGSCFAVRIPIKPSHCQLE